MVDMSDRENLRSRLIAELKRKGFGGMQRFGAAGRQLYATDASLFMVEPLGAVAPRDLDELVTVVKLCRDMGISLHPRGAATGLAGESLGPGLILDMHPHFRDIKVDAEGRRARVGAGTVLARLNGALVPHGLQFGPDPSSGTRATIGGMIGTNATGTHSLRYGYTSEHVRELRVVLENGDVVTLKKGPIASQPERWRGLPLVMERWADEIAKAYPKQHRNRCGYNLRGVWDGRELNPIPLVCGSEGTLALVVEAELGLVERPKVTGLAMFLFNDLGKSAEAVAELMAFAPSGLELIDNNILEMGRRHDPRLAAFLPECAKALLLGEWQAESEEALRTAMEPAIAALRRPGSPAFEVREAEEARQRAALWLIRREAEALVQNRPGKRKAISFVEDTAVPFERLGEWLDIKTRVLRRHNFNWATFGHAGAGELHTKIYIDALDPFDYTRLVRMAEELYGEAVRLGGTISGEHGDGLLRSPFIALQYPLLHKAFDEVKALVDPAGVLNPGRKTGEWRRHPIGECNRLAGRKENPAVNPVLHFPARQFAEASAACHGCAACRSTEPDLTMCPFFRLSHDEVDSPRAKGNIARMTLYGPLGTEERLSHTAREAVASCFNCKQCLRECPSHVDIPKLMLELKQEQVHLDGLSASARLLSEINGMSRMASRLAPLVNTVLHSNVLRMLGQQALGLSRDVRLPSFESGTLKKRLARIVQPPSERKLVYYVDYYALYNHHALALDFIALMNAAGWEVIPFTEGGCGLPALDVGALNRAKSVARSQAVKLLPFVEAGLPVVCTEPSAALMLKHEWPSLLEDEAVTKVAAATREATAFILEEMNTGRFELPLAELSLKLAHHTPCHLAFLEPNAPSLELLLRVPGLTIKPLNAGCCGMAGTFGLLAENRERSVAMATPLWSALREGAFDGVLTECSSCRMQIESGLPSMKVGHPIRLLARAWRAVSESKH